jgi:hypothetical protein
VQGRPSGDQAPLRRWKRGTVAGRLVDPLTKVHTLLYAHDHGSFVR